MVTGGGGGGGGDGRLLSARMKRHSIRFSRRRLPPTRSGGGLASTPSDWPCDGPHSHGSQPCIGCSPSRPPPLAHTAPRSCDDTYLFCSPNVNGLSQARCFLYSGPHAPGSFPWATSSLLSAPATPLGRRSRLAGSFLHVRITSFSLSLSLSLFFSLGVWPPPALHVRVFIPYRFPRRPRPSADYTCDLCFFFSSSATSVRRGLQGRRSPSPFAWLAMHGAVG